MSAHLLPPAHTVDEFDRETPAQPERPARRSQATELVDLALGGGIELWQTPTGDAYATVRIDDHAEHHRVRALARDYFARTYYQRFRRAASIAALTDAAMRPQSSPYLLVVRDASAFLGLSAAWLRQARMGGHGPSYIRVGRSIRYRVSDLEAWLKMHALRAPDHMTGVFRVHPFRCVGATGGSRSSVRRCRADDPELPRHAR